MRATYLKSFFGDRGPSQENSYQICTTEMLAVIRVKN